ncbi:hypothetical protein NM208_g386 [Fusarium decemcellulare]|uniref:Uncharacterized protein n=1 Tax=Fusarium decemcellulare TaxID=57161 RepID=A0ACC1SZX4_9HYPO|nr:hypothetical protein NM208_g386 [Fusarium decemcellulare]
MAEGTRNGRKAKIGASAYEETPLESPRHSILGSEALTYDMADNTILEIPSLEPFINQLGSFNNLDGLNPFDTVIAQNPHANIENAQLGVIRSCENESGWLKKASNPQNVEDGLKSGSHDTPPSSSPFPTGSAPSTISRVKVGTRFSREALRILKQWFDAHSHDPYPDEQTKEALQHLTGLNKTQLTTWLANARRRQKGTAKPHYTPPRINEAPKDSIEIPRRAGTPIPRSGQEGMDPLQRWVDSPPEEEPAPVSAIVRALSTSPSDTSDKHPNPPNPYIPVLYPSSMSSAGTSSGGSSSSAYSATCGTHEILGRSRFRRRKRVPRKARPPKPTPFECTFCTERFHKKHDWQRHENSIHLGLERWMCCPEEPKAIHPESGKLCCVFCSQDEPDDDHIKTHNPSSCQERAFNRKDHLKQHLRLVHKAGFVAWSMDSWKVSISQIRSRCGLCGISVDTWQERVNHLADHFKMGHTMAGWKGDWGFEPQILEMIENAIPPYLISTERGSPFPFRGTGTSATSPRTAYELISLELMQFLENYYEEKGTMPNNDAIQLEACRIVFASEVLSAMDGVRDNVPSSWLRDVITSKEHLSQQALFGPIRGHRENRLSSLEIKGKRNLFDECPLELELQRFVKSKQMAGQNNVGDAELQQEACRVVETTERFASMPSYDLVSNWLVKTILESTHWLASFRQRMNLPPSGTTQFPGHHTARDTGYVQNKPSQYLSASSVFRMGDSYDSDQPNRYSPGLSEQTGGAADLLAAADSSQPFWSQTSPYMLNDANFHERLGKELRRWVASTTSSRNPQCHVPTDEELRHQARWIAYGEDDPWNHTHADNPEWLERFKKSVGIPHSATNAAEYASTTARLGFAGTSVTGCPELQFATGLKPRVHHVRSWNDEVPHLPHMSKLHDETECALCAYIFHALQHLLEQKAASIVEGSAASFSLAYYWFAIWGNACEISRDERLFGMILEIQGEGVPEDLHLLFRVNTWNDNLAKWLGIFAPPSKEAWCPRNVSWVSKLLERTDQMIELPDQTSSLPTRLIDLEDDSSYDPRLVHTATWSAIHPSMVKYCALSYCWGGPEDAQSQLKTTAESIREFSERIPKHKLTAVMRDSIRVCRALGIRYLWIDALCIIQNDAEDWNKESGRMNQVYGNAYLTICAASSHSTHQSFLERHPFSMGFDFRSRLKPNISGILTLSYRGSNGHRSQRRGSANWTWEILPEPAPDSDCVWSTRGWTFQEEKLSKRKLVFGYFTMRLEAMGRCFLENQNVSDDHWELDFTSTLPDGIADRDAYDYWDRLVASYGMLQLTHESDRLPAFSGLAKEFALRTGDIYLAGLWASNLSRSLLWFDKPYDKYSSLEALTNSLSSPTTYIAPSWSGFNKQRYREFGVPCLPLSGQRHIVRSVSMLGAAIFPRSSSPFGSIRNGHLEVVSRMLPVSEFRRLHVPSCAGEAWAACIDSKPYAVCCVDWRSQSDVEQVQNTFLLLITSSCRAKSNPNILMPDEATNTDPIVPAVGTRRVQVGRQDGGCLLHKETEAPPPRVQAVRTEPESQAGSESSIDHECECGCEFDEDEDEDESCCILMYRLAFVGGTIIARYVISVWNAALFAMRPTLRCTRTDPCGSCIEAGKACEYREVDRKRRPASAKYVAELEDRVAYLESLITNIRGAAHEERDALLNIPEFGDHLPTSIASDAQHQPQTGGLGPRPDNLEPGPEGSLVYHGPTSIVHTRVRQSNAETSPASHYHVFNGQPGLDANFEQIAEHFGISMDDEVVTNALMLFFKWQYPQFMFIYREAFLRDHLGDRQNRKYWSSALLLSVCALGLLMSPNSLQRRSSEQFFSAAETMLIVFGFTRPSIATVQAFLCLAFYEIGRGNLSKGWGFSGVAFRMAQDLGFQRDPKYWVSYDTSLATTMDIEIRRRIFWGCYTSDKLISLTLGRSVFFSFNDAEVESLERLPDFPELEYWLPIGFDSQQGDFGDTKPLVPCFQKQVELSRVIEQMLGTISSSRKTQDSRAYQTSLDNLNLEMSRWQTSLPDCAKWNKWEATSTLLIPSVAALHLLFHGTRIAMNFDVAALEMSTLAQQKFRDHCVNSAQDTIALVRKYRSQCGLRNAPFVLVYGLAQASRCLSLFGTEEEVRYLAKGLEECSITWKIGHELGD